MKRFIINAIAICLCALGIVQCGMEQRYFDVPFVEVNGTCLVKPGKLTPKVIYDAGEFSRLYTGVTSSVNMGSNFIVAVCAPETSVRTDIKIVKVLNKEQSLYVKYTVEKKEKIQGTMLPHATVAISREYEGCDISFFDVTGME